MWAEGTPHPDPSPALKKAGVYSEEQPEHRQGSRVTPHFPLALRRRPRLTHPEIVQHLAYPLVVGRDLH